MAKILVIDDNSAVRVLLQRTLELAGHEVTLGGSREEMFQYVEKNTYDFLYLDINLPDGRSDNDLGQILSIDPLLDVIIITGDSCLEQATKLLKLGAASYMMKPFHKDTIAGSLAKLVKERRNKLESRARKNHPFFELSKRRLLGVSEQICKLNLLLQKVAKSPSTPVHLVGESGTGKELAAQIIHESSPRADKPFIKVNCAAIPQPLLESELFGHEKGAFTDARNVRKGLFELAEGGTLFLDEIGDLHPELQPKLLRVLESGTYRRVGSSVERKADVRVLSATNKDLLRLAHETGGFREDLYYRLAVMTITMPSLRNHPEDIEVIATAILRQKSEELGRGFMQFSTGVLDAFYHYSWPGNVRELRNVIERLIILSEGNMITLEQDVMRSLSLRRPNVTGSTSFHYVAGSRLKDEENRPSISRSSSGAFLKPEAKQSHGTGNALDETREAADRFHGGEEETEKCSRASAVKSASLGVQPLWMVEKQAILSAMELTRSKSECARMLGIARSTLLQKLEKYELETDFGDTNQ
ncbi:MAG: sigma-54 dependent transcriptional regulator [Candidatus Sumerlaeia bacterium]|nr:sigma-54 dependent transcriptional regulator [Candidatus Sumerlaeia bacterium]